MKRLPARRRTLLRHSVWRRSLPTKIERETLLTPEWVAESIVQEAERFLNTGLPSEYVARLAAKAYRCYEGNRHFHQQLRRADGREALCMYMRHWTCGWLHREGNPLCKKLPDSFGLGRRLPG